MRTVIIILFCLFLSYGFVDSLDSRKKRWFSAIIYAVLMLGFIYLLNCNNL